MLTTSMSGYYNSFLALEQVWYEDVPPEDAYMENEWFPEQEI